MHNYQYLIALSCLLIGLVGCRNFSTPSAQDEVRANFTATAEQLDAGGTYYSIAAPQQLQTALTRLITDVQSQLPLTSLSGPQQRKIQAGLLAFQMLLQGGGWSELQAIGQSSISCGTRTKLPLFRNRTFVKLPPAPRGALWRLPGQSCRPLLPEIAQLPIQTEFAADFELDLRPLGQLVKELIPHTEPLDEFCVNFTGLNFAQLLTHLSGEWGIVELPYLSDPRFADQTAVLVVMPDAQNKLFKQLIYFSRFVKAFQVQGDSILLNFPEFDDLQLLAIKGENQLIIAQSPELWDSFTHAVQTLGDDPAFQQLAAQVPPVGSAIIFEHNKLPQNWNLPDVKVDLSQFSPLPSLGVLTRHEAGWQYTECSGMDGNMQKLAQIFTPVVVLTELWNNFGGFIQDKFFPAANEATAKTTAPEAAQLPAKKPAPATAPTAALQKELALVAQLPRQVRNQCPAKIAALSSRLCWFKMLPTADAEATQLDKVPVAILCHPQIADHFGVLYRDGTTEVLQCAGQFSAKRAVSFLHTHHQYPEAVFLDLIRQATILDNALMDKK